LKRRELIKRIEAQGVVLIRHGGKHDWYQNPVTKAAGSRTNECDELIAIFVTILKSSKDS
jgi:mRNA interferase HicA